MSFYQMYSYALYIDEVEYSIMYVQLYGSGQLTKCVVMSGVTRMLFPFPIPVRLLYLWTHEI